MAFDYGLKRTGVAVTDPLGLIATPLETIDTSRVFTFIAEYLEKESVSVFVVGDPKRLSGEATHGTAPAGEFVRQLESKYPEIPVARIDERFTSRMASRVIAGSGIPREKRKEKKLVDRISAVLILQSYLENKDFIKEREGK